MQSQYNLVKLHKYTILSPTYSCILASGDIKQKVLLVMEIESLGVYEVNLGLPICVRNHGQVIALQLQDVL